MPTRPRSSNDHLSHDFKGRFKRRRGTHRLARGPVGVARAGPTVVLATGLLAATTASAQEPGPLVTDRPDQTESAESVPGGLFQLEVGWTYTLEREDGLEVRSHSVPGALLRIGLGSGLEARIGFAGFVTQDEEVTDPLSDAVPGMGSEASPDGAGDADLGLKWEILAPEDAGTRVALLGGVSLPTGRDGVGSERADPALRLVVSNDLSERVSLGYNAGVQWETVEAAAGALDTQTDLLYTVALGFGLADRVGAFVESFGFFGLAAGRADRHSLDGGFTVLLNDTLQLDTSAGVGLNDAAEDWFLAAGVSVRFPR